MSNVRVLVILVLFANLCSSCVLNATTNNQRYVNNESLAEWTKSPNYVTGKIFLNGYIDNAMATTICQKLFIMDGDNSIKRITLYINSGGGDTASYIQIANTMSNLTKPVDTVNHGTCFSAAAGIFEAATGKRYAYRNSVFLLHASKPNSGANNDDSKKINNYYNKIYAQTLTAKSSLPPEWFPLSDTNRIFSADKALQYHFIDEIIQPDTPNPKRVSIELGGAEEL